MKGILCWYLVSGFGPTNLNLSRNETYLDIQTYQDYISMLFRIS